MKKNKTKERVYTVMFMLVVTLVTVAAVSSLHIATQDIVERNKALFLKKAVLTSAKIDLPESPGEVASLFDELAQPAPGVEDCYLLGENKEICVFVRSGPGLWGDITAVIGYDAVKEALLGVTFTKHNETPGLGGRIDEEWFQKQFLGKKAPLGLVPEGTESTNPQEMDAVTGATITSKAVRDIVNQTYREALEMNTASVERAE